MTAIMETMQNTCVHMYMIVPVSSFNLVSDGVLDNVNSQEKNIQSLLCVLKYPFKNS